MDPSADIHLDPRKKNDEQILIKVWGRLGTSRRAYLLLKAHMAKIIEKSCTLLATQGQHESRVRLELISCQHQGSH